MKVAIIDYQSGNIASVANSLDVLGVNHAVTADPKDIRVADRVILPGVGRAAPAMEAIKRQGLGAAIMDTQVPFLGICLGMQLLLPFSEEDNTPCLGILDGRVKRFRTGKGPGSGLRVPQMGWNAVYRTKNDPLFKGIPDGSFFYFAHSYYTDTNSRFTLGKTVYGCEFVSILRKENFYGVQFHPERSGPVGLELLRNFCELRIRRNEKMEVIPAIDILDGKCVRLVQGDYSRRKTYSDDVLETARHLQQQGAPLIHIIDLNGAREGIPKNADIILEISRSLDIPIQVGGGIRTYGDARSYLDGGTKRVVIGTSALSCPMLVRRLVGEFGKDRIVVAVDLKNGAVAVKGWQEMAERRWVDLLDELKQNGVEWILLTDIGKDGTLAGPNFDLVERVLQYGFAVIAAGGISSEEDVRKLDEMGAWGVVIGKALYEGSIDLEACTKGDHVGQAGNVKERRPPAKRIIACMDIREGRVVKGTHYAQFRDAGDPVELGKAYSDMGADELVYLDITATVESRNTLCDLVKRIARNVNIPFTVGGGIKTLGIIRDLFKYGADKVSIGSAAVQDPGFVKTAAERFGSQCIVVSVDPKRNGDRWEIYIKSGKEATGIDAVAFAKQMESLGAGELLINSLDKDGMKTGYDIELLKALSRSVRIPIIASSGAGAREHFLEAFRDGGADAALAASLFHYGEMEISEVKAYLKRRGIPIRA